MRNLFLVSILAVAVSLVGGLVSVDRPQPRICETFAPKVLTLDEAEYRDLWVAAWAEWLAQECPPNSEVHVSVEWLGYHPGLMGYTARRPDGSLEIVLGSHLDALACWDTLVHEWAHALAYPDSTGTLADAIEVGGHTAYWGVAFSIAYNAVQRMPFPESVREWREAKRKAEEEAARLAEEEGKDGCRLPNWHLAPVGTTREGHKRSEATWE